MIVANSADLGVHKADRRFWEILRKRLELDRLRHILLIDDFGVNEQEKRRLCRLAESRETTATDDRLAESGLSGRCPGFFSLQSNSIRLCLRRNNSWMKHPG